MIRFQLAMLGVTLSAVAAVAQPPQTPSNTPTNTPRQIPPGVLTGTPRQTIPGQFPQGQTPQGQFPQGQMPPGQFPQGQIPGQLPPGVLSGSQATMNPVQTTDVDNSIVLPMKETFAKVDPGKFFVWRQNESWQIIADQKVFRDYGKSQADAQEVRYILQELKPTEWATIGSPRPVVEYGLNNGKPLLRDLKVRSTQTIDMKSIRAEQVRGAWVVRDDNAMLLNFGPNQMEATQAAAVVRKYGFNRMASVGKPVPVFSCFFASSAVTSNTAQEDLTNKLMQAQAENQMTRTGIPVPGAGFIGTRVVFDPRKLEVRKDRGEYVIAYGTDVFARCGASEWTANDALRLMQECRFTEYCKVSDTGLSFYLVNGHPPTKVPFSVQGVRFNPKELKVHALASRYGVYEPGGRCIADASTQAEAEAALKLIQAYQFDTTCQMGLSSRSPLKFLAKTNGH